MKSPMATHGNATKMKTTAWTRITRAVAGLTLAAALGGCVGYPYYAGHHHHHGHGYGYQQSAQPYYGYRGGYGYGNYRGGYSHHRHWDYD
jgi:hypothetical protein